MESNVIAFSGVGVAGMSRTLHAVADIRVAAAHHAFAAPAAMVAVPAAAAIPTQRKRRTATATHASVYRGIT